MVLGMGAAEINNVEVRSTSYVARYDLDFPKWILAHVSVQGKAYLVFRADGNWLENEKWNLLGIGSIRGFTVVSVRFRGNTNCSRLEISMPRQGK